MANHHNTGYKELFSHPEFVQQLIEGFAPNEIAKLMGFSTLKKHNGHYITPLFEEKIEDVVWSVEVTWQGLTQRVFLYILLDKFIGNEFGRTSKCAHQFHNIWSVREGVVYESQLQNQTLAGADLPLMYQELLAERADPEAATYRRLEALLGFDPDECPDDRVMTLYQDAQGLGLGAITELAAGAGSSLLSANQLKDWARAQGCESDKQNRLGWVGQGYRVDHQLPAWRNGVKAAHALRAQERIADAAIGNRQLAEWFAVPPGYSRNKAITRRWPMNWPSNQTRVACCYARGGRQGAVSKWRGC